MAHGDKKYEVWGIGPGWRDEFAFESDSAVEVVHWLRENRHTGIFNVHPNGPMFIRGKMIAHDFIWRHREAAVDDLIKKAIDIGHAEGVAKDILDLVFGR